MFTTGKEYQKNNFNNQEASDYYNYNIISHSGNYLFKYGKNAGHYLQIAYPEYPPDVFNPIYFTTRGTKRASQRFATNKKNYFKSNIATNYSSPGG